MAKLADDPKGFELEDAVAAHFASRGFFVETGVKERAPDELLELDMVWTDCSSEPATRCPVEVKSGDWGVGDFFKFYGWTKYLGLTPGQLVYRRPNGRLDDKSLEHLTNRTGVKLLYLPSIDSADDHFSAMGLGAPAFDALPGLWRYSYWAQRRLLSSLGRAIDSGRCVESAKKAKEYHRLINDALFFMPNLDDRVGSLLAAHLSHPSLAASAAHELESGIADFSDPPRTSTLKNAVLTGSHFPVQACLFLAHRARLWTLKALVELWLERAGSSAAHALSKSRAVPLDSFSALSDSMERGLQVLSKASSLSRFPVLWQTLLWCWGGTLRTDALEEDFEALSYECGVPVPEIPLALSAFDLLFPTAGGWFRQPGGGDSRKLLMLMPASLRGIGAYRRLVLADAGSYADLGVTPRTAARMSSDHNACADLLDRDEAHLGS